ncbi:hypothetical protein Nepgr_024724 [Nepenthes gracilis]|uniref:Uncharacterized protein n=1 Tax=Nepenthes gracilis TaxID=150966 RepID=A0AAD3T6G5_NEPGR|nr:hypothetical protein Nepgr_024724 [Nepenthes gracilis]
MEDLSKRAGAMWLYVDQSIDIVWASEKWKGNNMKAITVMVNLGASSYGVWEQKKEGLKPPLLIVLPKVAKSFKDQFGTC